MRHLFIIDENVIAQTRDSFLANESFEFFRALYENCHQIALSPELSHKLLEWLARRTTEFGQHFPTGPQLVMYILTNSRKIRWFDPPPESSMRQYVRDTNDWYLVDLAVVSGGHYVSRGDQRTRHDFNRQEFRVYSVDGKTVIQAIQLAKESCEE